jgi:hypothetical protein
MAVPIIDCHETPYNNKAIKVTASFGIATLRNNTKTSMETMIACADKASDFPVTVFTFFSLHFYRHRGWSPIFDCDLDRLTFITGCILYSHLDCYSCFLYRDGDFEAPVCLHL